MAEGEALVIDCGPGSLRLQSFTLRVHAIIDLRQSPLATHNAGAAFAIRREHGEWKMESRMTVFELGRTA
jgi:hypothetical protein